MPNDTHRPADGASRAPPADVMPDRARVAFVQACALDVMVRKPGNVSVASAGHGMQASQFMASAQASAPPLFALVGSLGERIEAAVQASWAAAGCNTNLGIVLLCAPVALAARSVAAARQRDAWQAAIRTVLHRLDRDDAAAAFRAIARASPAGLGDAPEHDVRGPARTDLRSAMALAASRDRIARQYAEDYREVFEIGVFDWPAAGTPVSATADAPGDVPAPVTEAVLRCYLRWLCSAPDSHIARKHGARAAAQVMQEARTWQTVAARGARLDDDPAWLRWDDSLKHRGLNPGTCADLTVVSLMLSLLLAGVI